jgi:cbb3-type cytochrome oxidase maturation protein
MSVIFLLITASSLVAGLFLAAFLWAVRTGQYDDDRSPAVRMLHDPVPSPLEPLSASTTTSRKDPNETM